MRQTSKLMMQNVDKWEQIIWQWTESQIDEFEGNIIIKKAIYDNKVSGNYLVETRISKIKMNGWRNISKLFDYFEAVIDFKTARSMNDEKTFKWSDERTITWIGHWTKEAIIWFWKNFDLYLSMSFWICQIECEINVSENFSDLNFPQRQDLEPNKLRKSFMDRIMNLDLVFHALNTVDSLFIETALAR